MISTGVDTRFYRQRPWEKSAVQDSRLSFGDTAQAKSPKSALSMGDTHCPYRRCCDRLPASLCTRPAAPAASRERTRNRILKKPTASITHTAESLLK
ncbi:MAG: hypothetical protein IKM62_03450 [Kiritimatiellae bacterium]|nr:hypothetical protein [Kiritimatiellia bacterium]